MSEERKYIDKNGIAYAIRKLNVKKADVNSPVFTGIPTAPTPVNDTATAQIATTKYVDNRFLPFEGRLERFDETINAIRGRSILGVNTAPYANLDQTPDGKVHPMRASMKLIKAEADIDEIFLGDTILYDGYLYQIAYIDHTLDEATTSKEGGVYLNVIGNVIGPMGPQGLQGERGLEGPKGDAGDGYFIVTDEDYEKIAAFIEENVYHTYNRSESVEALKPNVFYNFGPQYRLDISFVPSTSEYRTCEYMFQFDSPADRPTTLVMPAEVKWCYDPVIETGKTYQVSVLNNLAVICGA